MAGMVQAFDQTDIAGLNLCRAFLEDILWEREYHKDRGQRRAVPSPGDGLFKTLR